MALAVAANGFCADLSLQKVQDKGELVVGFCAQYPPFEFKTKTGDFQGFDVDLANAIGKEMNIPVKFKDGEWQGLIAGLQKGDYDILITCMGKNPKRMEMVDFSDTYVNLTEVLVVRKDESQIQGQNDLKDKIVGAQMATSSEKALNSIKDLVGTAKTYNYTTEAFLDLKFKRIDALISGIAYAAVQIQKDPSFKVVGDPLHSTEIGIALPKNTSALRSEINRAIAKIKADGSHQRIHDKWLTVN
ncbi:MAG: amino acid ABC transporter substrate-binding protein [Desulfobacter sp.]|nr:amino acid ABC transporter substrate-binding protein [Desulfobacter sp.]